MNEPFPCCRHNHSTPLQKHIRNIIYQFFLPKRPRSLYPNSKRTLSRSLDILRIKPNKQSDTWKIPRASTASNAAQTTVPCVQAQGRTYDRPNVQPLQHRGRHNKTRPTLSRAANTRGHTSDTYTEASLRAPFGYGRFLQGSLSHLETQIIHRSRGSMGQPRRLMRASRSRIATPWVEVCVKVHSSLCYVKKHIIFIHSHSRLYRYFRLVRLANLNQARINILNG